MSMYSVEISHGSRDLDLRCVGRLNSRMLQKKSDIFNLKLA
jgi:hypothetical protein